MAWRWTWISWCVIGAMGCGPAIELVGEDDEGTSGGPADTGEVPPSVSTSGPAPGTTAMPPSMTGPSPGTSTTTSPADTTGVDGSDGVDEDCGCSFLCDPCWDPCTGEPVDGCNEPFECDVWAQDCPKGEKCTPWSNDGGPAWNATRCSPVDPQPGQPGDPCLVEGSNVSGIDNCALGSMCWLVDPEANAGTCAAMCGGTFEDPQCADGLSCFVGNSGSLALCLPSCDPLLSNCADGQGCLPNGELGDAFVCLPAPSPQVVAPGTCAHLGGCEPGTVCVGQDVLSTCEDPQGCCTRWCDPENPICDDGLVCQPIEIPSPVPIGVCGD